MILIVAFAPASLFVWQALRWSWTWRREAAVRFCLCWILPFWVVLELTPTKLPHYILPTFPALALLIALAVQAAEAGEFRWLEHWASRALYVVGLLLIGGFAVLAFLLPIVTENGFVWAGLVPILAVAAVSLYTVPRLWRGEIRPALLASAVAAPLVFAPVLSAVAPAVSDLWISREIGRKVAALDLPAGTRFFASGYTEPEPGLLPGQRLAPDVAGGPRRRSAGAKLAGRDSRRQGREIPRGDGPAGTRGPRRGNGFRPELFARPAHDGHAVPAGASGRRIGGGGNRWRVQIRIRATGSAGPKRSRTRSRRHPSSA